MAVSQTIKLIGNKYYTIFLEGFSSFQKSPWASKSGWVTNSRVHFTKIHIKINFFNVTRMINSNCCISNQKIDRQEILYDIFRRLFELSEEPLGIKFGVGYKF